MSVRNASKYDIPAGMYLTKMSVIWTAFPLMACASDISLYR